MQMGRNRERSDIFDNRAYREERMFNLEGTEVTTGIYNLIIGAMLLWGLFIDFMISYFLGSYMYNINYIALIIIYFVMTLGGTAMVYRSSKPAVSFLGFTVMAAGFGVLMSTFLGYYSSSSIMMALVITALITSSMMIAGMIFPDFFMKIGHVLIWALLALVIVSIVTSLLGFNLGILAYAFIGVFCGYIGFDWARAQSYPKTIDNAIDSAADIFIDIVNIFIRILRFVGRSKD
jgi:FtsH-binding integral membrane protein